MRQGEYVSCFYCLILLFLWYAPPGIAIEVVVPGQLVEGVVSPDNFLRYRLRSTDSVNHAVRLSLEAVNSTAGDYVELFIEQREPWRSKTFAVPHEIMILPGRTCSYNQHTQTLCPTGTNRTEYFLSVTGPYPVQFRLRIESVLNEVALESTTTAVVAPAAPVFFSIFLRPEDFKLQTAPLEITVESDSDSPALVKVQKAGCELLDLEDTISTITHLTVAQSMTRRSFIRVGSETLPRLAPGLWFIKVSTPGSESCDHAEKSLVVSARFGMPLEQYVVPVVVSFSVFLFMIFIFLLYLELDKKRLRALTRLVTIDEAGTAISLLPEAVNPDFHGALRMNDLRQKPASSRAPTPRPEESPLVSASARTSSPAGSSESHSLAAEISAQADDTASSVVSVSTEGGHRLDLYSSNNLFVSDLNRVGHDELAKHDRHYLSILILMGVFYALPAFQLVFNYQVLFMFGAQDTCYYNFYCARPLGPFGAFNNIISNNGYVLLGSTFIGIVFQRSQQYEIDRKIVIAANQDHTSHFECGLPRHYYMYYALAVALIGEGIMSAFYHVCPTKENFQFDTSFMYMMAGLLILILYQKRHPGAYYCDFCVLLTLMS